MNESFPQLMDEDVSELRAELVRRGATPRDIHDAALRALLPRFPRAQAADAYMSIAAGKAYRP